MPRGAHLRLRNAAIKQVLANDACNAIFTGAYNYTPTSRRLTPEQKAANAAARRAARAAARAAPEAVAARRAKNNAAAARRRAALRAAQSAAVSSAVSDFLGETISAVPHPARRRAPAAPRGTSTRPRGPTAAQRAAQFRSDLAAANAGPVTRARASRGAGTMGGRRRGGAMMGGSLIGGRLMSLY